MLAEGDRDFRDWTGEANPRGATLFDTDLRGAHLKARYPLRTAAGLCEAHLLFTDLRGAILVGTDLRGAGVIDANLTRAQLIDTDLRGAMLTQG